jgi:hypothetical protein
VISEADAEGRKKPPGANAETVVALICDPVFVRDEPHVLTMRRRFATRAGVRHPSVFLNSAFQIEVHQQVGSLMSAGKTDTQVGRPHVETKLHGTERIAQGAIEECLLTVRIIFLARGRCSSVPTRRGQFPE